MYRFSQLLGALLSNYYRFRPQYVGLCVEAVPIGALLAVPLQKTSFFSQSRKQGSRTDSTTFEKRITWTSHLVRRAVFILLLPFADLAYALASTGPPMHFMVPTLFAGIIGFLSSLAIAEGHGLIMETYDTSDLHPGMTGRATEKRRDSISSSRRVNYSCYPRVSAAFAIVQTLAFVLGAICTAVGGILERQLGAQATTGVVAGILPMLTVALVVVLWRWKVVQIIPNTFSGDGRDGWQPVIIGNPSGRTRRMNILELGRLTRWTEIRRLSRLT